MSRVPPTRPIAVVTTVASRDDARRLALALVERKLAACAQVSAIESIYPWKGVVQEEPEFRLLLKTTEARYAAIEAAIRELTLRADSREGPCDIDVADTNGGMIFFGSDPPRTFRIMELWQYDATELARLIRTGQASAREAVDSTLKRLHAVNPAINAVVHAGGCGAAGHRVGPAPRTVPGGAVPAEGPWLRSGGFPIP